MRGENCDRDAFNIMLSTYLKQNIVKRKINISFLIGLAVVFLN